MRSILAGMTTRSPAALAAASVTLLAVLAGCGESTSEQSSEQASEQAEVGTIRTEPMPAPEPELPPVEPAIVGDCPYLSMDEATDLGGTPVASVRIDESLDPAACFFFGDDGAVVFTTTVHTVDSPERAAELVAESAPTGQSEQVTADGGWVGGSTEAPGGSLVALSRGDRILAVQTASPDAASALEVAGLVGPRIGD